MASGGDAEGRVGSGATAAVTCQAAGCGQDPAKIALTGLDLSQAVVVILAVLAISGEYSTGMIRLTLTATPSRWRGPSMGAPSSWLRHWTRQRPSEPAEAGGGYHSDLTRTFCLGPAPAPLAKLYDDDIRSKRKFVVGRAGRGVVTVTEQPLDDEGAALGAPDVYRGRLKRAPPPPRNANNNTAAQFEIEVEVDGAMA